MKKRITSIILLICLVLSAFSLCSCRTLDKARAATGVIGNDGTIVYNGNRYVQFTPSKEGEDALFFTGSISVITEDEPLLLARDVGVYCPTGPQRSFISYDGRYYCPEELKDYLESSPELDRIAIRNDLGILVILPGDIAREIQKVFVDIALEEPCDEEYGYWDWNDILMCDEKGLFAVYTDCVYAQGFAGNDYENSKSFIILTTESDGMMEDIPYMIPEELAGKLNDLIRTPEPEV